MMNQENKQEQENTDTPETQPQQEPSPETAEETFTVTRDQMEKMEQLAKMVSDASDKYLRLAAEYDNYRKRTAKEKESLYGDAKADTVEALSGGAVTTWSGAWPSSRRGTPTARVWR